MQSTSLFCGIKTANSPNPVSRLEKRSLYLPKKMHLKFCPSIINAYSYRPSLVRGGIPLPNKVHPITLTEYWPQSTHRELPLPVQHGDEGFAFEHDLPGREPPLLLTGCKWGIQRRILTFTMRGVLPSVVLSFLSHPLSVMITLNLDLIPGPVSPASPLLSCFMIEP